MASSYVATAGLAKHQPKHPRHTAVYISASELHCAYQSILEWQRCCADYSEEEAADEQLALAPNSRENSVSGAAASGYDERHARQRSRSPSEPRPGAPRAESPSQASARAAPPAAQPRKESQQQKAARKRIEFPAELQAAPTGSDPLEKYDVSSPFAKHPSFPRPAKQAGRRHAVKCEALRRQPDVWCPTLVSGPCSCMMSPTSIASCCITSSARSPAPCRITRKPLSLSHCNAMSTCRVC
jgi:hypothetical protein